MKRNNHNLTLFNFGLVLVIICLNCSSCKRYLDAKPDEKLNTIKDVNDLQLLLDDYENNAGMPVNDIFTDDFFVNSTELDNAPEHFRKLYLFQPTLVTGFNWGRSYRVILTSNLVLDELGELDVKGNQDVANNVKGSALFFRGWYHFSMAEIFGQPYEDENLDKPLGIPVRLTSNINIPSYRSSVRETYDLIVKDLLEASTILPDQPKIKTRPCKSAAYAALAKVFLTMRKYEMALQYATLCVKMFGKENLLNLNNPNDVELNGISPFKIFNKEVIFHSKSSGISLLQTGTGKVDSVLYKSFEANDLRKSAYFFANGDGTYTFKGCYDETVGGNANSTFYVLALDEQYLIMAECKARLGDVNGAMADLNALLQTRWKTGTYSDKTASSPNNALSQILSERRKELIRRGTRWSDIRRFRKDNESTIVVRREYNGETFELKPGSNRYVLLFPADVITRSNMMQND